MSSWGHRSAPWGDHGCAPPMVLRTFLMREPRGHAGMSGSILQPFRQAGRGQRPFSSSKSPACCPCVGTAPSGTATVLGRDRNASGCRTCDADQTRLSGWPGAGRCRGTRRTRGESVTIRNVPSFALALDPRSKLTGLARFTTTTSPSAGPRRESEAQALDETVEVWIPGAVPWERDEGKPSD